VGIEEVVSQSIGCTVAGLASAAVGLMLWLITLFVFLMPAFSRLRNFDPSAFRTLAILIKIGYAIGLVLLLLGSVIIIGVAFTQLIGGALGGLPL